MQRHAHLQKVSGGEKNLLSTQTKQTLLLLIDRLPLSLSDNLCVFDWTAMAVRSVRVSAVGLSYPRKALGLIILR